MTKNRTQLALQYWRDGMTPYAAAKKAQLSTAALYAAIKREEKKKAKGTCPCCNALVKPGQELHDLAALERERIAAAFTEQAAMTSDSTTAKWLTELARMIEHGEL